MRTQSILRAALPATVAFIIVALPAAAVLSEVALVTVSPTTIEWSPNAEYAGFQLVVSGPDGVVERSIDGGERPMLSLASLEVVSDGLYTWELRAAPVLTSSARAALSQGSDSPRRGIDDAPPAAGGAPTVMSGTFRVLDGTIVQPGAVERPARLAPERAGAGTGSASAPLTAATAGVVLTSSDGVIRNSLCVGFDCPNSPAFGADTIRLQENNLRIHFEDTSVGSFPTGDWRIEANSNLNGGPSYFAIQDADTGRNVLVVGDNAPSDSLRINGAGRVGLRTATPVLDLHIATGNSPGIRLEQTNASGFAPQTWDIAGNEVNFFVRDVTGGSTLPFRIQPGAPSSSIFVASTGRIGLGTNSPAAKLDVNGGSTDTEFRVTGNSAGTIFRTTTTANNAFFGTQTDDVMAFITNAVERMRITNVGRVAIGCANPTTDFAIQSTSDAVTTCNTAPFSVLNAGDSTFTASSSRSIKENIIPVETPSVLDRISKVPVYSYDFIGGPRGKLGLMAEDFHTIFERGSDQMINGQEVQMALWLAVQELTARVEKLTAECSDE